MAPDSQQSQPRLGFIGLGAMGSRMAGRLLAAGYDLTVFTRGREKDAYAPTFPLRLMLKDFGLILDTAVGLSVAMPTGIARVARASRDRSRSHDATLKYCLKQLVPERVRKVTTEPRQGHPRSHSNTIDAVRLRSRTRFAGGRRR
jgi:hypothetical protein